MSVGSPSRALSMSAPVPASLARVRRASLVVLVLLLAEYVLGMYVNLYVTVPAADHGHSVGSAISNGPVILSAHAVIGLLLGLSALAVLVLSIIARRPSVIVVSAAGLIASNEPTTWPTKNDSRRSAPSWPALAAASMRCHAPLTSIGCSGMGSGAGLSGRSHSSCQAQTTAGP